MTPGAHAVLIMSGPDSTPPASIAELKVAMLLAVFGAAGLLFAAFTLFGEVVS